MPVPSWFSGCPHGRTGRSRARCVPAVATLAFFALGACDEAVAPPGNSAAVDVRVYLDRDASGSFTAADSGLAGVALTLTPSGGEGSATEATSDAQGIATFPEVAPGSYSIVLPATAPAGTVLSTSAAPRVIVSSLGTVEASDIRYSWLPASITGRIFRDNDGSGTFTEGDTPGAGLFAVLSRSGATVDSVVSDAAGAYTFQFLTPGTYSLRLENPGSIAFTEGASRVIAVTAGQTTSVSSIFTGALVIPVAEARSRPNGATVAVIGNVTVQPGLFTSGTGGVNSEIWVQDGTGGIAAFSVPSNAALARGDLVEVSGTRGAFNDQAQVNVPRFSRLSGGSVPAAVVNTAAQAKALTRDGQLVRVPGLTIVSVPTGTAAAFNVIAANAADDTLQIRVAGLGTGLSRSSFVVGNRYDVSGVLTQFRGTAQIKIRDTADLVPGATITTLANVRAGTNGTVFTVSGRLSVPPAAFPSGANSELWVQDATGGIAVFSVPTSDSTVYQLGNTVEVTGTLGAFNDQKQLGAPTVVRTGTGSPVAPVSVTGVQVNNLVNEGRLISLAGFTVTTIGGGTGAAFNVDGTTADGATVRVRVSGALRGVSRANFAVGQTYTVTGILSQFRGAAQIKVRFASDITP